MHAHIHAYIWTVALFRFIYLYIHFTNIDKHLFKVTFVSLLATVSAVCVIV